MNCKHLLNLGRISLGTIFLYLIAPIASAEQLPNGGILPGEISMPGEIDEFSFTASAGETIYIRVADTETTEFVDIAFDPFVALIGPSGNVIASGGSSTTGGLVAGISLALVEDGTYSVRVSDDGAFDGANTGSYKYILCEGSRGG